MRRCGRIGGYAGQNGGEPNHFQSLPGINRVDARGSELYDVLHMLEEIRKLLAAQPFVPFVLQLTNGQVARVPTVDHAAFAPTGKVLILFFYD